MRAPLAWLCLCAITSGSGLVSAADRVDYETQIKPLFERHCIGCHGVLRQQGGLRLDAIQFLRKGGDSGESFVPNRPELSTIVASLKGEDGLSQMPQEAPALSADEIALVERWIAEGATAPDEENVEGDPASHWAFQPIASPALPDVPGVSNPVDAFVVDQRPEGLVAVGPAPRNILLRRIYLDLVGVPPTPAELHAFLSDESPDAYERVVDRLLSDPRYGERWGRHWMDVWRYSDWYGYRAELRNSQRHIWHWRDWIIESLNANKPYDRMIVEMLAADEVAPADEETLRATGFLARNYYVFNRDLWLDRTVEHTGKAFLGLTFNCARCHDHMFDPVSQRDYFAMRAFFEPYRVRLEPVGGVLDTNASGLPRAYDADAAAPTYLYIRGDEKRPDKENPIVPVLPGFFVKEGTGIEAVPLPPQVYYAGLRAEVRKTLLDQATNEVTAARGALDKLDAEVSVETNEPAATASPSSVAAAKLHAAESKLAALKARIAADDVKYGVGESATLEADITAFATTAVQAERGAALAAAQAEELAKQLALVEAQAKPEAERAAAVMAAQKALDETKQKTEAARKATETVDEKYTSLTEVYPATSTGRRTALAKWITDPSNPLTARVAVNHVWMRHFGKPLVESVFDFGLHGTPPSHPQLLDWLAADFVASGWDMKRLHRQIVTSDVYRLASSAAEQHPSVAIDPDNRFLWRMNSRRAEGEIVRDSLLAVSGRLDSKLGGPELAEDQDQTTLRRSLYYRHAPEKYSQFLKLFDAANADDCYRRAETIVPQQALAQMNSRLSREQSRAIAGELIAKGDVSTEQLIDVAFERLLCRPATSEERAACVAFLAEQEARLAKPADLTPNEIGPEIGMAAPESPRGRAFASLVHVLVNHHDFITIR